jgi:long-chain acyl-CoA synthetase
MTGDTLLEFFLGLGSLGGDFLVYDDGYRVRRYSYAAVAAAAAGFAARLQQDGVAKGDAVLIWSENRPEWVAAFWGCVLAGAVAVPIDYRSSAEFAARVRRIVGATHVLVGDEVAAEDGSPDEAAAAPRTVWRLADLDWADARRPAPVSVGADDTAEIIFTSGATAEPKGVVITHRNILANVRPIEAEILKYRRWGRPFFPLRFLDLLPLSHLFGQAMATFIPPLLPGTVVFMRGYGPGEIVAQVKRRRISVVVCVPKMLDVLGQHAVRAWPVAAVPPPAPEHVALRWWRYRQVHRAFGAKFWCFVVGAAPLDPSLEEFWSRLGFLVIQGYGLTETAPIVTLNHPFAASKGSVGKAVGGTEVRLAPDGEILVRGDNVTSGYYRDDRANAEAFEDGWLRTGDVGELDAEGRLFVRGRKKEMIVTPEGLNVFPEDVERVVDDLPGVHESAVVGLSRDGEERVHAVVVLDPGAELDGIVRAANARLADHQRIRGAIAWPGDQLPRTEGTRKLKRREIRRWAESGQASEEAARRLEPGSPTDGVETIVGRFAAGRTLVPGTSLEELGLSSLDRVELMVALEERFGATLDEARLAGAKTIADVEALVASPSLADPREPADAWEMPAWNRAWPARWVRNVSQATWVLPLARLFARVHVEGLEHVRALGTSPVVFAANHQSHMDTPAILAALPAARRRRVAVAMAKEYFAAYFHPEGQPLAARASKGFLYGLGALFFNAFPLPQREAGTRRTLRYIGDLLGDGWSLLIFPEGERTDTGRIGAFRAGIGMIGARLDVPVVPVRLEGLERVLHKTWSFPRPGRVRVIFGAPLQLEGDDYAALAGRVEAAVRQLG